MRPVERGSRPLDEHGKPKIYSDYSFARRDLIDRMGQYCSYCNQKLPASLAVEHIQPKNPVPDLKLEWTNFLLACTNCNSTKGVTLINADDYIWPDLHNTHLAFKYNEDGTIEINETLSEQLIVKAENLLKLVGLQKYVDKATDSDRRWKNRTETFSKAQTTLEIFKSASAKGAEEEFIELISILAPDSGFFSVWMTVFADYPKVKKVLIESFKGTASNAFDENQNSIIRTDIL